MEQYINKVIQGDCLEVMKGIPDNSIDCIITDPPYGMKYQSARRTATPQFKKIENDNNIDWFPEFIKECYRVLKNNSHIYIYSVMIITFQSLEIYKKKQDLKIKEP